MFSLSLVPNEDAGTWFVRDEANLAPNGGGRAVHLPLGLTLWMNQKRAARKAALKSQQGGVKQSGQEPLDIQKSG